MLRTLSQVMPRSSVAQRHKANALFRTERVTDHALLRRCEQAWNNLDNVRRTRERVQRYVFGDQWADVIDSHNGKITERRWIQMKGNVPLQNNVMISIQTSVLESNVRKVKIRFRSENDPQAEIAMLEKLEKHPDIRYWIRGDKHFYVETDND